MMIIRELGRGKYSDCFKAFDATRAVALKLSYYRESTIRAYARHSKHGDMGAARHAKELDAISVSMAMAEVAKQMRRHRVSPHIVTVYCEADVPYLPLRLRALLAHRLPHLTPHQIKYSHVCVMELFSCNLTRFAKTTHATDAALRGMLFQVVYTLACLQKLFPGFRHNDLSTNNVLVRRCPCTPVRYAYGTARFVVHLGFTAALADFDFTHVSGHDVLSNERVLSGKYRIHADHNPCYDTHLLLKTLEPLLGPRAPETTAFIQGLKLDAHERLTGSRPNLVPEDLLRHAFFAPLRCEASAGDVEYAMPTA